MAWQRPGHPLSWVLETESIYQMTSVYPILVRRPLFFPAHGVAHSEVSGSPQTSAVAHEIRRAPGTHGGHAQLRPCPFRRCLGAWKKGPRTAVVVVGRGEIHSTSQESRPRCRECALVSSENKTEIFLSWLVVMYWDNLEGRNRGIA